MGVDDALLLAVSARARGQLRTLDLSGCDFVSNEAVFRVLSENAQALRVYRNLHPVVAFDAVYIAQLLHAAPQLEELHVEAECTADDAAQLLRREAPYGPLRLGSVTLNLEDADEEQTLHAAAALAQHESARELRFTAASLGGVREIGAVVDAALATRATHVTFFDCLLTPASGPALARLLAGAPLQMLFVWNQGLQLLDDAAAALWDAALRDNATLTFVHLASVDLWHVPAAGALLVAALAAHPQLEKLELASNPARNHQAAAGAALGALLAADSPALHTLDVERCGLGDAGLGLLFDGLARNTHLRTLRCSGNGLSDACVHTHVLPAVRANASLQALHLSDFNERSAAMTVAQEIVDERRVRAVEQTRGVE
jgi:hypothetical protein